MVRSLLPSTSQISSNTFLHMIYELRRHKKVCEEHAVSDLERQPYQAKLFFGGLSVKLLIGQRIFNDDHSLQQLHITPPSLLRPSARVQTQIDLETRLQSRV